jgi:hypothetical protein
MDSATSVFSPPFPDEPNLQRMINNLMPKSEVFSGQKFFTLLLKRRGVEGVMNFAKKATEALDKGNDLDLSYDFDEIEREAFNASRLQFNRRTFLRRVAWQVGGAASLGYAGLQGLEKVVDLLKPTPSTSPDHVDEPSANVVGKTKKAWAEYIMPVGEGLIGAALIYEGHENAVEMKLEQISDAILQLAKTLEANPAKSSMAKG